MATPGERAVVMKLVEGLLAVGYELIVHPSGAAWELDRLSRDRAAILSGMFAVGLEEIVAWEKTSGWGIVTLSYGHAADGSEVVGDYSNGLDVLVEEATREAALVEDERLKRLSAGTDCWWDTKHWFGAAPTAVTTMMEISAEVVRAMQAEGTSICRFIVPTGPGVALRYRVGGRMLMWEVDYLGEISLTVERAGGARMFFDVDRTRIIARARAECRAELCG